MDFWDDCQTNSSIRRAVSLSNRIAWVLKQASFMDDFYNYLTTFACRRSIPTIVCNHTAIIIITQFCRFVNTMARNGIRDRRGITCSSMRNNTGRVSGRVFIGLCDHLKEIGSIAFRGNDSLPRHGRLNWREVRIIELRHSARYRDNDYYCK